MSVEVVSLALAGAGVGWLSAYVYGLEGIEAVGAGTLLATLVTLFGLAVKVFITAGDNTSARFKEEVERGRLREAEKDEQIDRLTRDRDLWLNRYVECREGKPLTEPLNWRERRAHPESREDPTP